MHLARTVDFVCGRWLRVADAVFLLSFAKSPYIRWVVESLPSQAAFVPVHLPVYWQLASLGIVG